MSVLVLTWYNEDYATVGDLTSEVAQGYCNRLGYKFEAHGEDPPQGTHPYWMLTHLVREAMFRSDYVVWLDCDVLILRDIPIEEIAGPTPITVATDHAGICCTPMILRRCYWMERFADAWDLLRDVDGGGRTTTQASLQHLMANYAAVRSAVTQMPIELVATPRSGYLPNAWAMHYWTSAGRLDVIRRKVLSFKQNGWTENAYLAWAD